VKENPRVNVIPGLNLFSDDKKRQICYTSTMKIMEIKTGRGENMKVSQVKIYFFCLICLPLLLSLTGCSDGFTPLEDYEDEYEVFYSYDIRELEEQVEGYWSYYEENEKQKERKADELRTWKAEYLNAGEYTVGKDIPAGFYICKTGDISEDDYIIVNYDERYLSEGELSTQHYRFDTASYILLKNGGVLTINENTKIVLADETSPSLAAEKDGIYYSGSYKVGEEIPRGEYFMLSTTNSHYSGIIEKEGERILAGVVRFGHVTIDEAQIINMEAGILIPLDKKPAVHPINYQGEGEGAGKQVFAEGIYRIGVDLPLGTYQMKNELFRSVTDLSYEGYHGNESYYPRRANRAGIRAEGEEDAKHFTWKWLELDSHINSKVRYLKLHPFYGDVEESYQKFKGLPTVTFTEKDTGRQIRVVNCVLIPTEED
jgi:hypothetical protein